MYSGVVQNGYGVVSFKVGCCGIQNCKLLLCKTRNDMILKETFYVHAKIRPTYQNGRMHRYTYICTRINPPMKTHCT